MSGWHLRHDGVLVVDPHDTLPERRARRIVERRDDGSRALAMIQRERELHPVCDRTGARVETCLSCGGRGCTEELREALARAQAGAR